MNNKSENPQAFSKISGSKGFEGMTLRDYFAAKVLQASLSHEKNQVCLGGGNDKGIKAIAEDSFVMADAMLKARIV